MLRRLLYALGGGAAGAIAGFFLAGAVILFGAAIVWLFIFGDDPGPSAAENGLTAFGGLVWLLGAIGGATAGWKRAVEAETQVN